MIVHLRGKYESVWCRIESILFIQTRGTDGKPPGWPDGIAAQVTCGTRDGASIFSIDEAGWDALKNAIELDNRGYT